MTLKSVRVAGVKKRILKLEFEEDRGHVGAVQHVLQVVGGGALPVQRFLQLAVEGGKLLVERLQLLLRGEQLLVRRLVFLVDGQGLFVDRLLLLGGDFEVADGALQFRPRRFEFLLEFGHPRPALWPDRSAPRLILRRHVGEADQQKVLAVVDDRLDVDVERDRVAILGQPAAIDDDSRLRLAGLLNRQPEPGAQPLPRHGEQIVGRMPGRHAQIALSRSEGVEALVLAVDQHRGRRIMFHHQPPAQLGEAGLARQCRLLTAARARAHAVSGTSRNPNSPGRLRPVCR